MRIIEEFSQPRPLVRAVSLAAVLASLLGVYLAVARPWVRGWGATSSERQRWLPGDDIIPSADDAETRAITIPAPEPVVWAWISQLGQDRGGFYTFELLQDLVGCEMPAVYRLEPALQRWTLGDKLWMCSPQQLGGSAQAELVRLDPGYALGFATRWPGSSLQRPAAGSWTFVVQPYGKAQSRLLIRGRGATGGSWTARALTMTVFEPLHFALERRTMETIRDLAAGRGHTRWHDDAQVLLWTLMLGGLLASAALVLAGRQTHRRLLGVLSAGLILQLLALVQPPLGLGALLLLVWSVLVWLPRRRMVDAQRLLHRLIGRLVPSPTRSSA